MLHYWFELHETDIGLSKWKIVKNHFGDPGYWKGISRSLNSPFSGLNKTIAILQSHQTIDESFPTSVYNRSRSHRTDNHTTIAICPFVTKPVASLETKCIRTPFFFLLSN